MKQFTWVSLSREKSSIWPRKSPIKTIRMVSRVEKRASLHSTALGKVFLAYLPEDRRKEILDKKELLSFIKNTITDKEELEEDLEKVREEDFALDIEENEKDVRCIAAPIRNYQGEVIAAISISSPAYRIDVKKQKHLKESLISISRKVSKRLGYHEK